VPYLLSLTVCRAPQPIDVTVSASTSPRKACSGRAGRAAKGARLAYVYCEDETRREMRKLMLAPPI
jgi:hypothetical protein